MFQIIYDPILINSFISTMYFGKKDVLNSKSAFYEILDLDPVETNFCFPVIPGDYKYNLFYLSFDQAIKKWNFYHSNKYYVPNSSDIEILLFECMDDLDENDKGYIGVRKNGKGYLFIRFDNESRTYMNHEFDNWIDFGQQLENYNDIIIPTVKGLAHLNSKSTMDLIFSTITFMKTKEDVDGIIKILVSDDYYQNLEPTIQNLRANIQKIKSTDPKPAYSQFYQKFKDNDSEYFQEKMASFQKEVVDIFQLMEGLNQKHEMAKTISNFISNLKKDLSREISTVYHRLRHFPHERLALYRAYPDHPYVKLIKMIHCRYLENKDFISDLNICAFLEKSDINLVVYDEKTQLVVQALATRSELFTFMYEQYLDTLSKKIKPKYNTKYNYFPFKVFSPYLFIIEYIDF